MYKTLLLYLFVVCFSPISAQRKQGSWQEYLSFANATKIAVGSDKLYCATEGGLFYYDLQDNSINKLTGLNGLSDFGIKTIVYNEENKVLIVAYINSNIDLVYNSGTINLSDIKRKQITGDKTINNITIEGTEAYVSCGFGIVVLNLEKREIKDTYFIGDDGSSLAVNDVEIFGQYIYAGTNEGILKAEQNSNLLDYNNWDKIDNIPHANDKFSHLIVHNGQLIVNYTPDLYNSDIMYKLEGESWQQYLSQIQYVNDAIINGDYMLVASRGEVYVVDSNHIVVKKVNSYVLDDQEISTLNTRSAAMTTDGVIWVADNNNGLIKISGENYEAIIPGGPLDNNIFTLNTNNKDLWITAGGRNDSWGNVGRAPQFQLYHDAQWTYFTRNKYPELLGFNDIVAIAIDPFDPDHIFAGSWGGGILEFQGEQFINRFTHKNSVLQTALPPDDEEYYTRIGGLDFDSEGNLWITNSTVPENLLKLTPNGEWETFTLPEVKNTYNIGQILVTQNDDKWILVPRGNNAYVVDRLGTQKQRLLVTSYFNNGENEIFNRMSDVYSIAEDNEGAIWIGTSQGVAVYNNPERIWTSDNFYAVQPSLDLNDGLYHPLLETETVNTITVDGANRKWLGTKNSGVYLVSENGEKEILHFTKENSPLLSNTITSIAINQISGEIFIGTAEGLVSYQGDAIEGKNSFENVYVYPNPIRENYDGPVTVTGLLENTDVKITDISGNLVYGTTSLGGQAVWDGKNLNGNRVRTGVYLVFCTDEFGEETHIAKLLFIN